ncbi:hypothetical protein PCH_Pc13g03820 [Penicillium rubens Wisconsin 54-1255]|uniref:Uncharacterized protein n=1 Tax=Penicillium rubens (strain ATCC 28089 / DSM 1075 / NRRL 1951 / Wisconsin 54-1255) TaxID=500485 RepID=B6H223_PENRW|nr:hypothetical protein PCH_Pc13g03820 [Penicillium rubens Wisconsin 54-1255]
MLKLPTSGRPTAWSATTTSRLACQFRFSASYMAAGWLEDSAIAPPRGDALSVDEICSVGTPWCKESDKVNYDPDSKQRNVVTARVLPIMTYHVPDIVLGRWQNLTA